GRLALAMPARRRDVTRCLTTTTNRKSVPRLDVLCASMYYTTNSNHPRSKSHDGTGSARNVERKTRHRVAPRCAGSHRAVAVENGPIRILAATGPGGKGHADRGRDPLPSAPPPGVVGAARQRMARRRRPSAPLLHAQPRRASTLPKSLRKLVGPR